MSTSSTSAQVAGLVRALGPERVMLGSDLPTLSSSFGEMLFECVVITAIAVPLTALLVAFTRSIWLATAVAVAS